MLLKRIFCDTLNNYLTSVSQRICSIGFHYHILFCLCHIKLDLLWTRSYSLNYRVCSCRVSGICCIPREWDICIKYINWTEIDMTFSKAIVALKRILKFYKSFHTVNYTPNKYYIQTFSYTLTSYHSYCTSS